MNHVRPGISVLLDERHALLRDRRVGVLTGPSGVLPDLTGSVDALMRVADIRALFGPEHGILGAAAEGVSIADGVYRGRVPVYSLYGANNAPTPEQLADIDIIVCDIQDIGCRFYTYAWTLVNVMQAAAAANVALIITDRPNPLGDAVEGPGVSAQYRSLVGLHDMPIRHGLSLGELVLLVRAELHIQIDITIIPCDGWRRSDRWSLTNLPWAAPSPNMPTAEAALIYPGTCLIEGTNLSVGRGTTKPFEWLGAPWIDGAALAEMLNQTLTPGVRWRAVAFIPCAGPYAGSVCQGVQPHIIDADTLQPVLAGVALLAALLQLHGDRLAWNIAHFDRLAGSDTLRKALINGASPMEIAERWRPYETAFRERAASFLLYA